MEARKWNYDREERLVDAILMTIIVIATILCITIVSMFAINKKYITERTVEPTIEYRETVSLDVNENVFSDLLHKMNYENDLVALLQDPDFDPTDHMIYQIEGTDIWYVDGYEWIEFESRDDSLYLKDTDMEICDYILKNIRLVRE